MSDIAIRIENLSKQYRLGIVGTGALHDDLNRWWHRVRGKEDPYLKIGETNDRAHRGSSEYVWALRDINLEVKQGEVLGIIGKNGAGKSTLLKILSKVTGPTTGRIMAKGRIASLLEVGTGFHPELTGRENIFLNGAILGMTKAEVSRKLDEIVDFAGVERYLDTPVKRYSSGMKVRLGFAVAAFLEEEILIVDEVLAVGDAEFQKKAIGKMQEVSSGGGRTVLFVSHNMASIEKISQKVMLMEKGALAFLGEKEEGISKYLSINKNNEFIKDFDFLKKNKIFKSVKFFDSLHNQRSFLKSGDFIHIQIEINIEKEIKQGEIRLLFKDKNKKNLFLCNNAYSSSKFFLNSGRNILVCKIPKLPLPSGKFFLQLTCFSERGIEEEVEELIPIEVIDGDFFNTGKTPFTKEGVFVEHIWESPTITN